MRHGSRSHPTSRTPGASLRNSLLDPKPCRPTQMLHALYVPAHATAVALTGYQRDLQHRLEFSARRRQPLGERPKVLEVDSVGGMIARFDAIEQLATGSLAARRVNAANEPAIGR